jgi:hypothetical protein
MKRPPPYLKMVVQYLSLFRKRCLQQSEKVFSIMLCQLEGPHILEPEKQMRLFQGILAAIIYCPYALIASCSTLFASCTAVGWL